MDKNIKKQKFANIDSSDDSFDINALKHNSDEALLRGHTKEIFSEIIQLLRKKNGLAALRAAEQLANNRPNSNTCRAEYARHLVAANQDNQARVVIDKILASNPYNVDARKLLGSLYVRHGKLPEAMEEFATVIRQSPADSFSHINLKAITSRLRPASVHNESSGSCRAVIATSLPPSGFEASVTAVNSWFALGFEVISVNTESERDQLRPYFPMVDFRVCEATAKEECGKDYQYLDSLLNVLAECKADVCGVVNADIVLRGGDEAWRQILEVARKRFVFTSRINVDSLEQRHGLLLEPGYDLFFFPGSYPSRVPPTGFVFGQPAWDVFFPAWAALIDFPRSFCYSPVALHLNHKQRWSNTANSRFSAKALAVFAPHLAKLAFSYPGASTEYLRLHTVALGKILGRSSKGGARPFFCVCPEMENYFAPVDPCYWVHDSEQTLVIF